jgi:hypothetical protein
MKSIPFQLVSRNRIELAGLLCVLLFGAQFTFVHDPLARSSPDNTVPKESKVASVDRAATEREIDRQHLQRIYKAISAYYQDHQELPDWLSDLVPNYLPDENDLISPVEQRTGKSVLYGRDDPKLHTSYIYEFNAGPAAEEFNRERTAPLTCKQWKMMQLKKFGLITPILRCHLHKPVLNVAYSGDIYESGLLWETDPRAAALIKSNPSLGPRPDTQSGPHVDVHVVDAETGAPLVSASIKSTLGSEFGLLPPAEKQSDTNGIVPISIGEWKIHFLSLTATHPLYQPIRFDWSHDQKSDDPVPSAITIKMVRTP